MLRKCLGIILLAGCSGFLQAQVITNKDVLEMASRNYRAVENENYAKALKLAKDKGWSLTIKSSNGRNAVLVGVDAVGHPKYYITQNNTIAAATTKANQLWPGGSTGLNLTGSSAGLKNKLGIWDEGKILTTHVELTGRVTQKDNASSLADHATHVAGTMIASGINPIAKGMAYGIQGMVAYDFDNDFSEMFSEASNLILSNHSYGIIAGWNYNSSFSRWEFWGRAGENEDYKFGYYSEDAQLLDSIAFNAPNYLIVKAAGNNRAYTGPDEGTKYYRYNATNQMVDAGNRPAGISSNDAYGSIAWDANAKNILTVGAVEGIPGGYNRKEDVIMSSFSSWGPTDDGRIKPDLVADGVEVYSSNASSNTGYDSRNGTSHSSPNATGSLLLLQEYWSKLKSGAFMRSATLKGLGIHSADEAGSFPGPDYKYGWGLLNVEKAAAMITAAVNSNNASTSEHLIYENNLLNGQSFSTTVIASGKSPLIATISWTDPKGTVETTNMLNNPAKKLVNDLDIRITKGTRTYFPWILNPASPSLSASRGNNITDNVERINIDSTIPGETYTITVTHKGSLQRGQQAYSLLVSGGGGTAFCASAPTSTAGARIDSVVLGTLKYENPAGCTSYTNATNFSGDIESSQPLSLRVKTSSCDASANPRIVTVYIDFNNNGLFDASEKIAQSTALANNSTYITGIITPAGLSTGAIYLMRVIVQETSVASDVNPCGNYTRGETADFRLKVVAASNDLSITGIISPASGNCAIDGQYLTVSVKNNGSNDQSNIPFTATITNGANTIANFSTVFKGTLPALSSMEYTFPTAFNTIPATSYTISSTVNLAGDQNLSNNTLSSTVVTAAKPSTATAAATICNNNALLKVLNPSLSSNYYWYNSPTATTAFAVGSSVNTSTIPSNNTFYLGKESRGSVGPTTKLAFPNGGYNYFSGNYINFKNDVPLTIESARLYTGYAGTIIFTVANYIGPDGQGGYNYYPLSEVELKVEASNPNPTMGAVTGNPTTDTGKVYRLNLPVNTTGDHIIIINCLDNATIFRNNGITGNSYPFSIPNVMSITGNSAVNSNNTADTSFYKQFYYFLYDVKVNTNDCVSDRVPVVATLPLVPVISLVADSLVSSLSSGNQWYLNDTLIAGATRSSIKPIRNGVYKSVVTDASGCGQISNSINFQNGVIPDDIFLNVSPNPNKGRFQVSFEVFEKNDLSLEIFNSVGQKLLGQEYPGFNGKFSKTIYLEQAAAGLYILKIRYNNKTYLKKFLIQR